MAVLARVLVFVTTILQAWKDRVLLAKGARKAAWGCLPIVAVCMVCSVLSNAIGGGTPDATPVAVQRAAASPASTNTTHPSPSSSPTASPTPEPSALPTATATTAPTNTSELTATQAPTEIPAPPTPTVVPTATREPTPTSLADDPTVQSYLTETGGHVNDIAGALSEMGDLFQNPRFGNDEWTLQVAARFVTIQFAHKALSEMQDVPEVMRPMHTKLLEGTTACDRATREATEGLDAFNVAKIEDATESLNKCTEKVQEATALLPTQ